MVTVRPLVATVLCVAVSVIAAQAQVANESQVKSAYLYNFAKMASWPQEALPTATSKLVMCVLGGDADFPDVLRSTLAGKNIGEHPIEIRQAQSPDELKSCHLVFFRASAHDHLVEEAVLQRLLACEKEIPVSIALDPLEALSRMLGQDIVQLLTEPQDFPGLNVDVTRLSLHPPKGLVEHDTRMWQGVPLPFSPRRQQPCRHARRLSQTERRNVRPDILHRIVNGEAGSH